MPDLAPDVTARLRAIRDRHDATEHVISAGLIMGSKSHEDRGWLLSVIDAARYENDSLRIVAQTALDGRWKEHVPVTGTQHDPANGLIHGYCVRCRTPWPCEWSPEASRPSEKTGLLSVIEGQLESFALTTTGESASTREANGRSRGGSHAEETPMEQTEHITQFFAYEHLPARLQDVSRPFCEMAAKIIETLPRNPERTVALRKLLEAKDAAVRALIAV